MCVTTTTKEGTKRSTRSSGGGGGWWRHDTLLLLFFILLLGNEKSATAATKDGRDKDHDANVKFCEMTITESFYELRMCLTTLCVCLFCIMYVLEFLMTLV